MNKFHTVTKEEFYKRMDPLDVHPTPEPNITRWKLRSGRVVGLSWPGYLGKGDEKYQVLEV